MSSVDYFDLCFLFSGNVTSFGEMCQYMSQSVRWRRAASCCNVKGRMSVHPKAFSSVAQRLERARAGHGALSSRPSRLIITFHIKIPKRKPALIKASDIY